jgi:5-methylthioadenosine/S-adenosylhomocysteine deaminase
LVKDALIETFDGRSTTLKGGYLYTEGGKFVAVGKKEQVMPVAAHPEFSIDGRGKLVMPGFVNTHVHLAQSLLRGLVPDDVKLMEWLTKWVWPIQASFTGYDGVLSARLALAEMIRAGTTAFVATSINGRYDPDGVARAVLDSGMRAALGRQVMDVPGYATKGSVIPEGLVEDPERSLSSFRQLHKRWDGREGRIWIWLSPRSPGACTDELYGRLAQHLHEYDAGVTMHLAEVRDDLKFFNERGTTPSSFLRSHRLLKPKAIYVHCVWITVRDMMDMARAGCSVSHNPSSNMKLGSGIAPVSSMIEHGVNVTLGTDGGPSNDSYDLIREAKVATLLQKVANLDPSAFSFSQALEAAISNGYRALGIDGTAGKIREGYDADFIVLDLRRPHLIPSLGHLSNLVYSACGSDVRDVVVGGQPLMMDGKLLTLDEEEILDRSEEEAAKILERAGLVPSS